MDIGVVELAVLIGTLSTAVAVPVGLIKWCGGYVTTRVDEERKDREAAVALIQRDRQAAIDVVLTKIADVDNRIGQTIGHKANNTAARVDGLERQQQSAIERIVKVETAVQAIDKSLERVEHGQIAIVSTITERFDTLTRMIVDKP